MNVYQLKNFVNIAEAGNIKKAAEEAFISRQAASRAIQTLEKELGFSLFDRSKRGVRLTAEGEALLAYAKNILHDFDELNRKAAALSAKNKDGAAAEPWQCCAGSV